MYNPEYYDQPQGPQVPFVLPAARGYGEGGRFRSPYPAPCASCGPWALPATDGDKYRQGCEYARGLLCTMSKGDPAWCNADCATVQQKVCTDCGVFVGDRILREALCCTATCPAPQPWADPTTGCASVQPPTCPVGTHWDDQQGKCVPDAGGSLILGLGAIAACALVATVMMVSSKKKAFAFRAG